MFHFLYKKRFLQLVFIAAMALWALHGMFFQPIQDFLPLHSGILYPGLRLFFLAHPFFFRITLCLLFFSQLVCVHYLFSKHNFLESDSTMPLFWFLFFYNVTSFHPLLSPGLFTNLLFLFILILTLNSKLKDTEGKQRIFFCALLTGMFCLIDITAWCIFPFIIILLIINHIDFAKKLLLAFIGFLLPFLYLFSILYLNDNLHVAIVYFQNLTLFHLLDFETGQGFPVIYFLVVLPLTILYVFPMLKLHYDNKLVTIREKFAILCYLFVFIMAGIMIGNFTLHTALPYLIVPLSLAATMICQQKQKKFINDFFLLLGMSGFIILSIF